MLFRSLWFVDREGGAMFKVFVARDAARALNPVQVAAFTVLRDRLAATEEAVS